MSDFVLVYSGGSMPQSAEEQAQVMAAWTSWFGGLGAAVKDPGNPFTPAGKRLAPDGSITDVAARELATGYSILDADSLESALAMAKDCPVLQGGASVSVYETFQVM
jgi:hypothetical protein